MKETSIQTTIQLVSKCISLRVQIFPIFFIVFQTNYLSQVGGLSVGDNTRRILAALLTTDLAKKFTMHRYAFKDMHFNTILVSIRDHFDLTSKM